MQNAHSPYEPHPYAPPPAPAQPAPASQWNTAPAPAPAPAAPAAGQWAPAPAPVDHAPPAAPVAPAGWPPAGPVAMHLVPVQTVPGGPVEYVPVQLPYPPAGMAVPAVPAGPAAPTSPFAPGGPVPGPAGPVPAGPAGPVPAGPAGPAPTPPVPPGGPGRATPPPGAPLWTRAIGILAVVAGAVGVVAVARHDDQQAVAAAGAPVSTDAPTDGSPSAAIPELKVSANEFSFDSALTVAPGWVQVTMDNTGGLPHQASLYRLHDGVDGNALSESFKTNRDAWIGKADPIGGSGGALAGTTQTATVNLAPGRYIVTCFLRGGSAAGQPHVMFGMSRTLDVAGTPSGAAAPTSAGEISLRDDAIVLPPGFTGKGTYHLENEGTQPHELSILTLNPGKTPADFTAFMKAADSGKKPSGPPPFTNAGGFTILDPGLDGYVTLDLAPGTYLGADFIPDPTKKNAPHLLNGGQVPFTVPA